MLVLQLLGALVVRKRLLIVDFAHTAPRLVAYTELIECVGVDAFGSIEKFLERAVVVDLDAAPVRVAHAERVLRRVAAQLRGACKILGGARI